MGLICASGCAGAWRSRQTHGEVTAMRSVDEQLGRALAAAVRPAPVRVAISEAQGLLCAEEVVAERALPGFDQAAVDGYAVRSVDVQAAGTEPGAAAGRRRDPGRLAAAATAPAGAGGARGHRRAAAHARRRGRAARLHRRPPRAGDRQPAGAIGGVRPAHRRGRADRRRRRAPRLGDRLGTGRAARRGRAGQGARVPAAPGVDHHRSARSSSTSTAPRARARSTTSTRTRSPRPRGTRAPRSTGSASCRATRGGCGRSSRAGCC